MTCVSRAVFFTVAAALSQFQNLARANDDLINSGMQLLMTTIFQQKGGVDDSHNREINGTCYYQGSSCNGAEIRLTTEKNVPLQTRRITSSSGFSFADLNPENVYKITVRYDKFKMIEKTFLTRPGTYLTITIEKPVTNE